MARDGRAPENGKRPTVNPDDLLTIAEHLASGGIRHQRGRPRQAELCRAVSAIYYALFHTLANDAADLLVGSRSSTQTRQAWRQMYRALEHARVKRQCTERRPKQVLRKFPLEIQDFADQFVFMQRQRHIADYDPLGLFLRSDVSQFIERTKSVISDFKKVDRDDRRAFAVFVLFDLRRD